MKIARNYFRAGVGAVIIDARGSVLVGERQDRPGAWQFPQGGIENAENPMDAVLREIQEETGLGSGDLRLIASHPEWLCYELPEQSRSEKTGWGQAQRWFLFKLSQHSGTPNASSEFRKFEWVSFDIAVDRAVAFKKPVYRKVREFFSANSGKLTT